MLTSKINAVIHAKCPKCHRGKIFSGPMYGIKLQKTNEFCPNCGMRFEVEPGYFYAAMYVSYAFNVAQMVILGMLTYYLSGEMETPWLYIGVILAGTLLFSPFNYRYSRVILLHYLTPKVKYNSYYDSDDYRSHV
ncbi:DUF983 domain-containing protein [Daejeonella oryzae]|uniref:DUF983 domain-containing protein n=1 Tax=Daejeonella oryzae TaxID=1122943 RepID=UPI00040AC7DE|nr:DUF983 domain-containing protein [Daejeonella oryzae]